MERARTVRRERNDGSGRAPRTYRAVTEYIVQCGPHTSSTGALLAQKIPRRRECLSYAKLYLSTTSFTMPVPLEMQPR